MGPQRGRPHRHGRDPAARQGRLRPGGREVLDAAGAPRAVAGGRRGPRHRCGRGADAQDAHVAGYVVEEGKGLVVAVNKWDLVEDKTDRTFDQYVEWIRNEVPFLDFAPIISISAKTGQRVGRVLEAALEIWGERRKRISTGELNRVLAAATDRTPPPPVRGHRPRLFYATQAGVAPPTFVFFASDASAVHFSYRRYLENRLRETFGFDGSPIRLVFRDRDSVKLPRRKRRGVGERRAGDRPGAVLGRRPRRRVGAERGRRAAEDGASWLGRRRAEPQGEP